MAPCTTLDREDTCHYVDFQLEASPTPWALSRSDCYGHENTLFPALATGACLSDGACGPLAYVSGICQKLQEVHQQVAPHEVPTRPNPN